MHGGVLVSLQGSLETFALPDVLTLLASTAKSGELRVTGAGTGGDVERGAVAGNRGRVVSADGGRRGLPARPGRVRRLPTGEGAGRRRPGPGERARAGGVGGGRRRGPDRGGNGRGARARVR